MNWKDASKESPNKNGFYLTKKDSGMYEVTHYINDNGKPVWQRSGKERNIIYWCEIEVPK